MFSKLQILNLFIDPSTRQQHQPFRGYRRAKLHIWDRNHTLYPCHLSCSTPPWKGPSPFQRAIQRDMFSPGFSTRSHSMRFGWSARRRHGKHVNTSRTQDYFCFYQNTAAAPAWRHPALPPWSSEESPRRCLVSVEEDCFGVEVVGARKTTPLRRLLHHFRAAALCTRMEKCCKKKYNCNWKCGRWTVYAKWGELGEVIEGYGLCLPLRNSALFWRGDCWTSETCLHFLASSKCVLN